MYTKRWFSQETFVFDLEHSHEIHTVAVHGIKLDGIPGPMDQPWKLYFTNSEEHFEVSFVYSVVPLEADKMKVKRNDIVFEIGVGTGRFFNCLIPDNRIDIFLKSFTEEIQILEQRARKMEWAERPTRFLLHYQTLPTLFPAIMKGLSILAEEFRPPPPQE